MQDKICAHLYLLILRPSVFLPKAGFLDKFCFYWLPVLIYMGVIYYLSSRPVLPVPPILIKYDKLSHFLEYLILGLLLMRALSNTGFKYDLFKLKLLAVIIAIAYAFLDELHQNSVPFRSADFVDWVFDSLGSVCGSFLCRGSVSSGLEPPAVSCATDNEDKK